MSEEINILGQKRWDKYINIINNSFRNDLKIGNPEELIEPSTSLFRAYLRWTWPVAARKCFSFSNLKKENPMVCAAILAVVNSKQPEVVLNILKYISYILISNISNKDSEKVTLASLLFCSFYRFNIINTDMMIQIILKLMETEMLFSQTVIEILFQIAPCLENDDYSTFTTIFTAVATKWKRHEKEIQKLSQWRKQNWKKMIKNKNGETSFISYSRIPFRLSVLEDSEYVTLNSFDINECFSDPTLGYTEPYDIEQFNAMHDQYKAEIDEIVGTGEEEDLEDIEKDVTETEENEETEEEDYTQKAIKQEQKKRMNLEFQKTIYLTISSTATASECAHKIAKILKEDDAILAKKGNRIEKIGLSSHRKIVVETLIEYIGHSQSFDRNQANIIRFLARSLDYLVPIIEFYFYDAYNNATRYKASQIINISKLYAFLISTDVIHWNVLSAVRLEPEGTTTEQHQFVRYLMEELAKGPPESASQQWLVKKLQDPEVAEATSGIFLTDTYEHADIVVQFFEAIGLGYLCDGVRAKIAEMIKENPSLAENDSESAASPEPRQMYIYETARDRKTEYSSSSDYSSSDGKRNRKSRDSSRRKREYSDSSSYSEEERRSRRHRHHKHRRHHHRHH